MIRESKEGGEAGTSYVSTEAVGEVLRAFKAYAYQEASLGLVFQQLTYEVCLSSTTKSASNATSSAPNSTNSSKPKV